MTLITPDYLALNAALHQSPSYGATGRHFAAMVREKIERLQTLDVLDYGAGKCALADALSGLCKVRCYDPCIPALADRPSPADIVVCTEVLEHIEPECLDAVLDDLRALTKRVLLASISSGPARTVLADGRNAHLIQGDREWWLARLIPRFRRVETSPTPRGPQGFMVEAWP